MAAMMASQSWLDAPTLAQQKKLQGKAEPASNGAGNYGRLQLTLALQWNEETSIMRIGMKKMTRGIHWDARLAQLRGPRSLHLDQKNAWKDDLKRLPEAQTGELRIMVDTCRARRMRTLTLAAAWVLDGRDA